MWGWEGRGEEPGRRRREGWSRVSARRGQGAGPRVRDPVPHRQVGSWRRATEVRALAAPALGTFTDLHGQAGPWHPPGPNPKLYIAPGARSIFTRSLPLSPAGGVNKKAAREGPAARTPGTNACNSQMAGDAVLSGEC